MGPRIRILIIVLIFAGAALLRSQYLFSPWIGHHNAWGGAMYGNIARNYVKYGYWETQLGPVASYGRVPAEEFQFYYHYPPLLVWLVSVSFHIFGVHEWSARLVPLFFSFLLMGLIYSVTRRLYDRNVALLALFLSAVMPIQNYYAVHVDVYGALSLFCTLLTLDGYARWLEHHRRRYLAVCLIGVVFGCLTAWYTYFLIPLILVHFHWLQGGRKAPRDFRLLALPACAIVVFVLFVLHRQFLLADRTEVHGTLLEKLWIRMSYGNLINSRGAAVTPAVFLINHGRDLLRLYTPPLVLLAMTWLGLFLRDVFGKRVLLRDWLVMMLFGFGFLHNAVFPSVVGGHAYLVHCYTPAFGIAGAAVSFRILGWLRERWGSVPRILLASSYLVIMLAGGLYLTQRLFSWDRHAADELKRMGNIIREHTDHRDLILIARRPSRVLEYYADRNILFRMDTCDEISEAREQAGQPCIFVCPISDEQKLGDLLGKLDGRYHRVRQSDPIIYALDQPAS